MTYASLPQHSAAHSRNRRGKKVLADQLPDDWQVGAPEDGDDYGIDGQISFGPSGQKIDFQLKSHERVPPGDVRENVKVSTLNLWLENALPVVLLSVDISTEKIRFLDISSYYADNPSMRPGPDQDEVTIVVPEWSVLSTGASELHDLAVDYQEGLRAASAEQQKARDDQDVIALMALVVFVDVCDGDIRKLRSHCQKSNDHRDAEFAIELEKRLQDEPALGPKIREFVAWAGPQLGPHSDEPSVESRAVVASVRAKRPGPGILDAISAGYIPRP